MQQFSAKAFPDPLRAFLILVAAGTLVSGCRKEEISSYSVPKENAPPPQAVQAQMPASEPGTAQPHWTAPASWQEQPASGMRVGSFTVTKDAQHADVSIIPLAGVSGTEIGNVNRWRGQLGLPPVDESKLGELAEKVTVGSAPASLYDFVGTDPQTQQPSRILAALLSQQGTTWFFKMTGSDALVEQEKPTFKEFLKSVQFGSASSAPVAVVQTPMSTNPKQAPPSATSALAADKPTWTVPAGWQEQPATSMRLATFLVTGENGAKADLSVIKLAGLAGGTLANVNRWRSQLGLEPVDQAGLDKLITVQDMQGAKVVMVDMVGRSVETGNPARLLAAIVPRSGVTWFYKMLGNDQLVAQQKPAFIKFVETARYPNAS